MNASSLVARKLDSPSSTLEGSQSSIGAKPMLREEWQSLTFGEVDTPTNH